MIDNLAKFGYLTRAEDGDHVTLHDTIRGLLIFRSVDPLYGAFLADQLARGSYEEKLQALESVLTIPSAMERLVRLPEMPPGPLQSQSLLPTLLQMGIVMTHPEWGVVKVADDESVEADREGRPRAMTFPEMLKALFDAKLSTPESIWVQPKWVAGGVSEHAGDFYKFIRARDLAKNEGLILRHLLRLVILTGEFRERSEGDPDYERIGEQATRVCQQVDPRYTDRFLQAEAEARKLVVL
jgi:hypothetical protein